MCVWTSCGAQVTPRTPARWLCMLWGPWFGMSGKSCHHAASLVDFEPFTASHCVVFTMSSIPMCGFRVWLYACFTATYADHRVAMLEWGGTVILGCNDYLPMSIGESALFINDGANESVREIIGPI